MQVIIMDILDNRFEDKLVNKRKENTKQYLYGIYKNVS